ncbi:MAG: stage 0 sporulation protein [Ruminococcaceae bacterium]|nr:stage 0 sporulation protein [Oscillospiraceae bacterium]
MERHSEFSKEDNIISDYTPSTGNGFITEVSDTTDTPATVEVIGVKFKDTGKTYYFSPGGVTAKNGDYVIVETARGIEFGTVGLGNREVPASEIVPPLRPVIRIATEDDITKHNEISVKEREAFTICAEKITEHGLGMKLIEAEYTFDESKLIFYFSADGRVDFRELVKDLASVFRTRIELRQIGIRDEAKLLGGLGVCGRPFCCTTFLSDFVQVSIKMAKEQSMSLNSSKISGTCGRLMCCLKYEHEVYEEEIKLTPPVDSRVKTSEGTGIVKETSPLAGKIKVVMDSDGETVKEFHRDNVTVIGKREKAHHQEQQNHVEEQTDAPKKAEGGRRRSHHSKGKSENKAPDTDGSAN